MSLNNEPCSARPTLINLNLIDLYYCPFMVGLARCNGIFNTVDDTSGT